MGSIELFFCFQFTNRFAPPALCLLKYIQFPKKNSSKKGVKIVEQMFN